MCIRDRDRIREEMVTKGGSIAVLVAEDEKMAQMVLNSMLKSLGAVATLTDDGSKCVKEFNANPKKYQIILMDFLMPTMNGIEATKEIRKKDPKNQNHRTICRRGPIFPRRCTKSRDDQSNEKATQKDRSTRTSQGSMIRRQYLSLIHI
eukprot:TRINITY_DN3986_c0_g1_i3.p1 TRINITY_DN3986_c0_g1~~TRINITY_DN3986_c0_g1_i3.p1  ORF type:complete len:164 (+),score=19.23 TRINITY_DN3986_c0_g1_i3:47-493(+)